MAAEDKFVPSESILTDFGDGSFNLRTFYSPETDIPETAWWFDDENVFMAEEDGPILTYES